MYSPRWILASGMFTLTTFVRSDVSTVNIPLERVMPKSKSGARAAPPPYHHGDLRRALIEAALSMLKEEGAWTFTLREVARRAGVSHAAPYNHFSDKAALLAEVAAMGFQALRERLAAA